MEPLCFVLMPFGKKPDPVNRPDIDFDCIYATAIRPAIEQAGMKPIRADEEKTGGIIHQPMFERLLLCEYAVADLTTANANVFYELGVRHAARPCTTQPIFARHQPIPFDVSFLRALPYDLGPDNHFGEAEAGLLCKSLGARLIALCAKDAQDPVDSPVFQLVHGWQPDLSHLKTDLFRERAQLSEQQRARIDLARSLPRTEGVRELQEIQSSLGPHPEAGLVVQLMLGYRSVEAWTEMIDLWDQMSEALQRQIMVREQLAFGLNRRAGERKKRGELVGAEADRGRAVRLLEEVEQEQGPSPETCGLLGRVHKDRWDETRTSDPRAAKAHLRKAVDAYCRGFDADWRDAYPGINAVTLLDIQGDPASCARRDQILPVVRFSVEQRLRHRSPDYWDHATMLELAVLESDHNSADKRLEDSLAAVRDAWEPKTTARNLELIRDARAARNQDVAWVDTLIAELTARAGEILQGRR